MAIYSPFDRRYGDPLAGATLWGPVVYNRQPPQEYRPTRKGKPHMTQQVQIARGLEGVYVTETKLCRIDGQKGELVYAGYDIFELAEKSSFEETAFLLWNLRLPTRDELASLDRQLKAERPLSSLNERILREIVGQIRPMRALEISVLIAGALDPKSSDLSQEQLRVTAARLAARMPTVIATYHRLRQGLEPVPARDDLGHAAAGRAGFGERLDNGGGCGSAANATRANTSSAITSRWMGSLSTRHTKRGIGLLGA